MLRVAVALLSLLLSPTSSSPLSGVAPAAGWVSVVSPPPTPLTTHVKAALFVPANECSSDEDCNYPEFCCRGIVFDFCCSYGVAKRVNRSAVPV